MLWPETSARRAYPLYYTLATPFIRAVSEAAPARGLNLFSAIWAAVAVGLLARRRRPAHEVATGRRSRGPAAGVLVHLLDPGRSSPRCTHCIWRCWPCACSHCRRSPPRPTTTRLAVFFAVYACAFGNHLGMILFLVPFTVFLVQVHPRPRELFAPSTILLAIAIAVAGALQYAPHVLLRLVIDRCPAELERPRRGVLARRHEGRLERADGARHHAPISSGIGCACGRGTPGSSSVSPASSLARLAWFVSGRSRNRGPLLVCLAYAISTMFALTYNVGDTHVFLLPGHFLVAVAIAAGVGHWRRAQVRHAMAARRAALRGMAGLGYVARRRSSHRSPSRRATSPTLADGVDAPECAARLQDGLATRERPAVFGALRQTQPRVGAAR